uniref:Uncharacterized protein n=1 Tax=Plectus sambesii TaxID=2011161 RepID=A0A914XI56_9BILA
MANPVSPPLPLIRRITVQSESVGADARRAPAIVRHLLTGTLAALNKESAQHWWLGNTEVREKVRYEFNGSLSGSLQINAEVNAQLCKGTGQLDGGLGVYPHCDRRTARHHF